MDIKSNINDILEETELIKNSGMVFLVSFVGSIFLFISNILLSRYFGPELFGNYKTMINLFLFLPSLIEFGAGATLAKYIAEYGKDKGKINSLIKWFLKFRVVTYFVLILVMLFLKDQIAFYFLKNVSLSNLVLAGTLFSGLVFFEVFKSIAQGFQDFKIYSFSQFLTVALSGLFTVVLGYYFGVFYAIVGWAFSYFVGNIPVIRFTFRKLTSKKVKLDIKKIFFGYSLPIHLMIIPGFLGTAAIPILSLFFNQTLIGYYSFAWVFYMGVVLITNALSAVLLPKVSEFNGKKNVKKARITLKRVFIIYTPIVILGIIGTLLFSSFVIRIISRDYLNGLRIFEGLICFGLLSGYLTIYRSYLSGLAEIKKLTLIVLIQNVVLFIVSFIFLSLY